MNRFLIVAYCLSSVLFAFAPSRAATGEPDVPSIAGDMNDGVWEGLVPPSPSTARQEPAWALRTGFRKGVRDQSLPEEVFAGPDAAVLMSGPFAEWTSLLATYQESFALVEPDGIAALSRTKPYLIIPSGGLAGLATSSFFRAGLAEYVRTGGVVLCFAQQKGSDLSALPVPEGSKIAAAGWTEDSGPLFRSSVVQAVHPVLTGLRRTTPSIETDGYLAVLPAGSQVLLRRPDGFPTLAVYSFGSGWIAVATLISDRSFGQGLLDDEERTLVRDLVLWAKAGGKPALLEPGAQLVAQVPLQGPEKAPSSSVKVVVTMSSREKALDDRTLPLVINTQLNSVLTYSYTLPSTIAPGIYHLEYALLDGRRVLSPLAESDTGWFAVLPKTQPPPEVPAAPQPLAHPGPRIAATPRVEQSGNRFRLQIEIARAAAGGSDAADLLARAAGQEIYFKLGKDGGRATIDLPASQEGQPLSYAVYHVSGRALLKGTVPAALFKRSGIVPDKAWYVPGQTVRVRVSGFGSGALNLSGLGSEREQMLSKDTAVDIPVPPSLPAGVYPIAWTFEAVGGTRKEGSVLVDIMGTTLGCTGAAFGREKEGTAGGTATVFSLATSADLRGTVRVELEGPGGRKMPLREAPFAVTKGTPAITVPVPFSPDQAGIWQLRYTFLTPLPEGPGFGREPLTLASGRILIDAGDAAVLDVRTDPPLTYAPAAAMSVTAVAAGSVGTSFDVLFDGKRIGKEKIGKTGSAGLTVMVKEVPQGAHSVQAVLTVKKMKSVREARFLSGALLPDLVVAIKTSDVKAPALEVGVGITNRGKAASPATEASLYEGDPNAGGKLIRSFPVPPLDPGKQHVAIIPWPLAGKAGTRTLVAAVDEKGKILETTRDNDRTDFTIEVPEVFLSVSSLKAEYPSDEPVDYRARVANFTAAPLKALSLQLQTTGPTGGAVNAETIALPDLAPGADQVIDRLLAVKAPPEGIYLVNVRVSSNGKPVADDSRGISVLPTLLVKGSLEGTPASAAPCRPLEIRTAAGNAGNVPPTSGTLMLEIRSKVLGQSVYTQQLPFVLEPRTTRIERVDFPRGDYTISLRGSAVNKQRGLNRDFVLAEQPLTVSNAVTVRRSTAPFPRVLVWAGGDQSTTIERALIEKLAKEAFAEEAAYLAVVGSADDFSNQALTGMFNDYLLIDITETLGADEALRNGLMKGHGVVIAGSGDRSRLMAEAFGFRFEPVPGSGSTSIVFPPGSGFGITGTLPVSGATLLPRRKNARTVASFADDRPAILLDTVERGKIMVLPFSLTRSALNSGLSTVYSRLVRETVMATMPQSGEQDDLGSVTLTVSSATGSLQARLAETLPSDATMLWSSVKPASATGAPTFEVTADSEPKTILYLFRPGKTGDRRSATEVFSACGGNFVAQGKVE